MAGGTVSIAGTLRGKLTKKGNVRGKLTTYPGGGAPPVWGNITGDIEDQTDLMIELRERDTEAVPESEVEQILYFD